MKLLPSDPDIQTIIARIKSNDLDLQPDFQRGEVWSDSKKRRLIDTILRDWHIPPIHVIERADSHKQEVLDGQQRLVAIRDFVNGLIRVDGRIEPIESDIADADNSTYATLPPNLRRRFDRFTIRIFRLIDFNPDEPGELFFRLNQPTSLTAAEQRNAFFGPVRQQVREICEHFPAYGLSDEVLGFSNSRMAFDDIVGKLCLTIERGTLRQKVTAATITERYRSPEPFPKDVTSRCRSALQMFGECRAQQPSHLKFNKATLYSWLCLLCRDTIQAKAHFTISGIAAFISLFERYRSGNQDSFSAGSEFPECLLNIFTDRASLRVGDVSSVLLRDAVLAYCYTAHFCGSPEVPSIPFESDFRILHEAWRPLISNRNTKLEGELLWILDQINWGVIK